MEKFLLIVLDTKEMEPCIFSYEEGKKYLERMEYDSILSGWVEDETGIPDIPTYTEKDKSWKLQNINMFGENVGNGIFMDKWGMNSFVFGNLAIRVDRGLTILHKEDFIKFLIQRLKKRRVLNIIRYSIQSESNE